MDTNLLPLFKKVAFGWNLYFELFSLQHIMIHSFGRVQNDPPFVIDTPSELNDYIKGRRPCPLGLAFLDLRRIMYSTSLSGVVLWYR